VMLERIDRDETAPAGVSADPTIEELLADPLAHDAWRLKTLAKRHARLVESSRAREILDDFDSFLPKIYKVVPNEFRRALAERTDGS
jgi:glutamate synthase domain-containing protein 3